MRRVPLCIDSLTSVSSGGSEISRPQKPRSQFDAHYDPGSLSVAIEDILDPNGEA